MSNHLNTAKKLSLSIWNRFLNTYAYAGKNIVSNDDRIICDKIEITVWKQLKK